METWFVWGIIPISPQEIPLYLHIKNEKLKVLSVYKLSMIEYHTYIYIYIYSVKELLTFL